jgi:hypothetical protein
MALNDTPSLTIQIWSNGPSDVRQDGFNVDLLNLSRDTNLVEKSEICEISGISITQLTTFIDHVVENNFSTSHEESSPSGSVNHLAQYSCSTN